MNARIAILAIAMAATAPAYAADLMADLSRETGLSERKVQMILGDRSAFPEYRISYDRSLAQFKRALGNDRYQRLISGQQIELKRQPGKRVVVLDNRINDAAAL